MVSQPSPVQENAAAVFWASLYSDNVGTPSSICSLAGAKPLSTAGVTSVWVYFPVAYFVWEAVPGSSVEGAAEHPASASSTPRTTMAGSNAVIEFGSYKFLLTGRRRRRPLPWQFW